MWRATSTLTTFAPTTSTSGRPGPQVRSEYLLSAYYVKDNDPLNLFERMQEDGAFGALTHEHDGRVISRDMLDSILEISFLDEHVGLSRKPDLTVLDIGAGYGRLAYRMAETLPNLSRYFCVDAVAESTMVSELYARHRAVDDKVTVVPLDEAERVITGNRIDVAVNIHSFSECALSSIDYWLDLIGRASIPWIFVVPNTGDRLITSEPDGSRLDFFPVSKHAVTSWRLDEASTTDPPACRSSGSFPRPTSSSRKTRSERTGTLAVRLCDRLAT